MKQGGLGRACLLLQVLPTSTCLGDERLLLRQALASALSCRFQAAPPAKEPTALSKPRFRVRHQEQKHIRHRLPWLGPSLCLL